MEDKPHLFLDVFDFLFKSLEILKDDVVLFKELSELRELVEFLVDELLNLPGYGLESFCRLSYICVVQLQGVFFFLKWLFQTFNCNIDFYNCLLQFLIFLFLL